MLYGANPTDTQLYCTAHGEDRSQWFSQLFCRLSKRHTQRQGAFEKADWHGVQQANVDRLELYKAKVAQTVMYLEMVTNKDIANRALWIEAKKAYTQLVFNFPNFEIAETFFNSVFSALHDHDKINDDIIYVLSSQLIEAPEAEYSIFVRYEGSDYRNIFRRILKESEFSLPGEDIELDLDCILEVFKQEVVPAA